ncbi:MAG: 3'-5' exonuclease [Coleofasciculus sp. B1-GNL1-01]|uniref:3'-5' exonuclease n=1 Tax=Coleofasciculus sp. B1-GNL1-01 TaxID=3068484 RepID=UPI0032F4E356
MIITCNYTSAKRYTIKLIYPEYQQGNRYEELREKIIDQLLRSCEIVQGRDWDAVLGDFEGYDSVPIMTIHKSKGLEHHTVIFVGLDDDAWWSFPNQPEESRCAFFVALSRAKQRIIFTYCKQRSQGRNKISSLYDILNKAGVKNEQI